MQSVDGASNSSPESNNVTPPSVNDEASNVVEISSESSTNNQEISSNNLDAFVRNNTAQNSFQGVSQTEVKDEVKNVCGFTACGFGMENTKLPKFSGDVREYVIFRADFKHAIESRYAKRDAITLLRTCLTDKQLDLIRGIESDYETAWEYLDSINGDPRLVAVTVTRDIVKLKPLSEGEEARFCDLVHLVRRCYNTLKEVGIPSDMDNSYMLSMIEQNMV